MKKLKPEQIKYRFFFKVINNFEYRVFESRYYAEKWLYEVYLNEELDPIDLGEIWSRNGYQYEIKKTDDGFVIYKIKKDLL